jgi:cysteinyl-tRNA synthetase
MLKLYNTLTRKKDIFKPLNPEEVKIYSCGPTVYWYQHIGNLRSYINTDILKRVLLYNNYKVKSVINVTDVGHLTSDEDEGEDKIESASKTEGKSAKEISEYYFRIFKEDLKKLNIIEPNFWPKATEHIQEQIELIKILEKKGYTYQTHDGIYFDTSKFRDYGKFAKLSIENLQAGKRVSIGEKKNKTDFALWKFSEKEGVRQQEWESPWGVGFPGWHIECSAMSMKYLGEHFDIHTGGEDHIPVHHTNEIAQSECAIGKKWVNYWIHWAFLKLDNEKMSKSKGKILTLSDLEKKEFSALDFRYFCLTAHYKKQLNFTIKNLENAKNSLKRLRNIVTELDKTENMLNAGYLKKFESAINNDLDIPKALQIMWEMLRDENAKGKIKTLEKMDKIFGLDLLSEEKINISKDIKELVKEREKARKNKDWKKSDELREKIKKKGWQVDDIKEGWKIKKI